MKRILVIKLKDSDERLVSDLLSSPQFDVVVVDPYHPHWPKMLAGGNWDAIVIESLCLKEIAIEVDAELELIPEAERIPIFLFGRPRIESHCLPTALRNALQVKDLNQLLEHL